MWWHKLTALLNGMASAHRYMVVHNAIHDIEGKARKLPGFSEGAVQNAMYVTECHMRSVVNEVSSLRIALFGLNVKAPGLSEMLDSSRDRMWYYLSRGRGLGYVYSSGTGNAAGMEWGMFTGALDILAETEEAIEGGRA